MKKFLLCSSLLLMLIYSASASSDLCFDAIQSELIKKEGPRDLITLQNIELEKGSIDSYDVYAWIEDRNDRSVWPYHSFWTAKVKKTQDTCIVLSLDFVQGNM